MKININGVTRDMTAEEIAKFEQLSVPEPGTPSDTERINALETLFLELSGVI